MIALAVVVGMQALVLLAMALRQSGLKTDAKDADHKRQAAEKQLQITAHEFAVHRKRTREQLGNLRSDISKLEVDLALCSGPGARRARLEQLLSQAADLADDHNDT